MRLSSTNQCLTPLDDSTFRIVPSTWLLRHRLETCAFLLATSGASLHNSPRDLQITNPSANVDVWSVIGSIQHPAPNGHHEFRRSIPVEIAAFCNRNFTKTPVPSAVLNLRRPPTPTLHETFRPSVRPSAATPFPSCLAFRPRPSLPPLVLANSTRRLRRRMF